MTGRDVETSPLGLAGILNVPRASTALVLFAHGSGSSRLSPRNTQVAEALWQAGLGTLLFDLLTESEAADRENVFDIGLLAERLFLATNWARQQTELRQSRIGYFGAGWALSPRMVHGTIRA